MVKPTEADIKWCIEHKEFVNGLLERRGGWQIGDWYYCTEMGETSAYDGEQIYLCDIWLPTEGDAFNFLAMEEGTLQMTVWPDRAIAHKQTAKPGYGDTVLTSLLELLERNYSNARS